MGQSWWLMEKAQQKVLITTWIFKAEQIKGMGGGLGELESWKLCISSFKNPGCLMVDWSFWMKLIRWLQCPTAGFYLEPCQVGVEHTWQIIRGIVDINGQLINR